MEFHHKHPLYFPNAEPPLMATYIWVNDKRKALHRKSKTPVFQRLPHNRSPLAVTLSASLIAP